MIPAAFDYTAPETVADALAALASDSEEIKVMAGGQSLIPVLRLRLAAPTLIVDIGRIAELHGVSDDGDALVIGALTTHDDVVHDPMIAEHAALLAKAAETIGDPQVRHRGTFGGALAHADPAGDMPAAAVALDAEMTIVGPDGERTVAARSSSRTCSRRRWVSASSSRRSGCPSTPDGAATTRSSPGWRSSGPSSGSPRPSGPKAARSPRPRWR